MNIGINSPPEVRKYNAAVFFFNDTATTEIYTLSLHDALPILPPPVTSGHAASLLGVPRALPGPLRSQASKAPLGGVPGGADGGSGLGGVEAAAVRGEVPVDPAGDEVLDHAAGDVVGVLHRR